MPPDPKNPIYDLLHLEKEAIDAIVLQNNAYLRTLIELQIVQISQATGKPIEEVRKRVQEIYDEKVIEVIDALPKVVKP